ncbi:MAG: hypothetical protein JWQ30_1523 [Sediminibacterium sp.]|nr:hypothetical protein [Sediminibacterium sp.]
MILLADDDIDDAELLQEAIAVIAPYVTVAIVTDGQQAAEFLAKCPDDELPAAVLFDYHMSPFNGPELLAWICNHERLMAIPKFVWGTLDEKTYAEKCKRFGATQYFVKPVDIRGVLHIAKSVLTLSGI